MSKKIAIIQFPGSNCERETQSGITSIGADADIIRWNVDRSQFESYVAYVLPGGFSYQDRVRAGVISSKLPIVQLLKEANAMGKPILGICNGCQILAEAGFIMDLSGTQKMDVALTPNRQASSQIGFMCDWTFVKIKNTQNSVFTQYFKEDMVIPIPVNHGEGRFVFKSEDQSFLDPLTTLYYCDEDGQCSEGFPVTPNGSQWGVAGVSNAKGNVLGIMPHPERAYAMKQVPAWISRKWEATMVSELVSEKGPWSLLFKSFGEFVRV